MTFGELLNFISDYTNVGVAFDNNIYIFTRFEWMYSNNLQFYMENQVVEITSGFDGEEPFVKVILDLERK